MPALSLSPLPEPMAHPRPRAAQAPRLAYIYGLPPAAWLAIGGCLLFCAVGLRLRAWRIRERARERARTTTSRYGNGKGIAEMMEREREREDDDGLLRNMSGGGGEMEWEGKAGLPLPSAASEARNDGGKQRRGAPDEPMFRPQPATATAQALFADDFLDGPEYTWQTSPLEALPALSTSLSDFASSSPNEASAADIPRRRSYTKTTPDGVAVQGAVVVGESWRRHTRVYGGGVCLACLESEEKLVGMGMKA